MKKKIACFTLLFCSVIFAQDKVIVFSGRVTDSLQQPLENVTLISKLKQEKSITKYAITNSNGYFKLLLKTNEVYELNISLLGYNSVEKEVFFLENTIDNNIKLSLQKENLKEVIINYKYQPIKKSKDTITYNLNAFTNGNEFKMKDVLEKLPGVKIEDNVIKVQGKTVTKLLVEGKLFFDGSTKLAVENIPADVMSKIEIISNYKESELLRNLADNEDLALNVILKEDKKEFAFGDLEMGAGVGFDEFYSLHPALFKYNIKSNISFIGDINNFNNSSLNGSDLSRLVGGTSNLFKKSDLSSNLMNFLSNNQDRYKSTSKLSAINFLKDFDKYFSVNGYAIYINNDILNRSLSVRKYLGNEIINETRNDNGDIDNSYAAFSLKLNYNPSILQKWVYNVSYFNNASDYINETVSSSVNTNQFFTGVAGDNDNFSHNLEGYFNLNNKHTMGLALHYSITNSNFTDNWVSKTIFLQEYLPFNDSVNYKLEQKSDVNSQKFNLILKDYWLTNKYFHLFYNIGLNYRTSKIENEISQIIAESSPLVFKELTSNSTLKLSDLNAGLGLKTQLGKFEVVLEAKPHYYRFRRTQIESSHLFIEPKLDLNFKFGDDIKLEFSYDFTNRFLNDLSYLENLKVSGFNSVLKGNPNLTNSRSHNFSLFFSEYKNIDRYLIDASIEYSINKPAENNSIIQSGINRLNIPVLLNMPETNISFNTQFGLMFNKSSLEFGVDLDWLKINQLINENLSITNSFEYRLSSKWLLKLSKNKHLYFKFENTGFQVNSNGSSFSTKNIFSLNFDAKFFHFFLFKTNFSSHFINDFFDCP